VADREQPANRQGSDAMGAAEPARVFISYASQDADAAMCIRDALREAGLEVWFDQSELRGGDAWDASIRKKIKECTLFVPIISANTNARSEGYFRLEWKLAVDRTHLMADDQPFLLPVVIEDTPEAAARVPDRFRERQWSRVSDAVSANAFAARVAQLGSGTAPPAAVGGSTLTTAIKVTAKPRTSPWSKSAALLILASALIGAAYFAVENFFVAKRTPIAGRQMTGPGIEPEVSGAITLHEKSVAVLPFLNMSDDKNNEYFSDGLAEELIDLLAKVPGLHVPARTSSFYFKGKQTTITEIAKALGVANVLEGSVRKAGNTLRVTTQLIRIDDGHHVWSETYDRKVDDIFKIQDEIAVSVVNALKISLLEGQTPRATPTANSEAYTLYLQAHAIRYKSNGSSDSAIATDYLKQALKLDPAFAPAWAELANNLAADYSTFGTLPYQQTRDQAHDAVERALKLDSALPLAYLAMGRLLYQLDWNWDAADVAIRKAISLEPGNAEAFRMAGYLATTLGRFDEGIGLLKSAIALDPLQVWNYIATGFATNRAGDLTATERVYRKAIDLNPTGGKAHYLLGSTLLQQNRPGEALVEMQRETDNGYRHCGLALALGALRRMSESDSELAIAEKTFPEEKAYWIALVYSARNEPDRAFAWLDRAFRQHDDGLLWIKGEPLLKNLVLDPRYKVFIRKMNLPE
jgi:TolB-like protein/Tfp pilus assembly protein PilF